MLSLLIEPHYNAKIIALFLFNTINSEINVFDKQKEILYRQFHRLMDNDKMGSLFKALYFSNNKLTVPVSMI